MLNRPYSPQTDPIHCSLIPSQTQQQATQTHRLGQPQTHSQSRQRKIWLLEGGYASDTKHVETIEEKWQQHKTLLKALEMQSFGAQVLISTFGVGGTIYKRQGVYI